jgi:hypothetical protein
MKARRGVSLPSGEFEPPATIPSNPMIQLLDHGRQGIALGLHIARGGDHEA